MKQESPAKEESKPAEPVQEIKEEPKQEEVKHTEPAVEEK